MSNDTAIRTRIDRILPAGQDLMIQLGKASWENSTTGTAEAASRTAAIGKELRGYFSSPEVFAEIRRFREAGGAADPVLNRQLELLYRSYLSNQILSLIHI